MWSDWELQSVPFEYDQHLLSAAAQDILVALGINEGRLESVSYGEEKPVDPGHDESAWVKNRRVEFVPQS